MDTKMKQCKGCVHLKDYFRKPHCFKDVGPLGNFKKDIYTGQTYYHSYGKDVPTLAHARSPEGECGPDAKNYSPNFWTRLKNKIFGK
jgi:hypothetical protein